MISASIARCMSKDFALIHPEMPVVAASAKLMKHAMLGGPVVDGEGLLLGWISEQECLQVSIQVVYHNQRVATVRDIMRTDVLCVKLDDDPLELAQQMLGDKPKSYPVVDARRKVLGVVTRRHVLNLLIDQLGSFGKTA
ncbi:CBS domain-containing protein [Pseudomonas sp. LPB0260]|uniref:CBS domain-containing protein n=1 Tax=Pseudomonas sp. LPB0260 TaxID=2614442 RepID=UPI001C46AA92|nr:CBS domain-containing protein [Pseudomonas sp. LPB0260]